MKPIRLTPTVRAIFKVLNFVLSRKMRTITLDSHPIGGNMLPQPALAAVEVRSSDMRVASNASMVEQR